MAQHFNISLEDVQRLCTDGQSFRLVVGDINNGGNGAPQIIYTVPQNTPQAIFPQQTISLAPPLEQRPNVYIIKTSESTGAQNIIKSNTVATHLVAENVNFVEAKESKATTNNVQEAQQSQWMNVQENKITYESVLKQTTPLRNPTKSQQQNNLSTVVLQTQGHCSQPELQVYGSMEKKGPRFITNRGKILSTPQGTLPGISSRASADHVTNSVTRFNSPGLTRAKISLSNDSRQVIQTIRPAHPSTPCPRNAPPILQRTLNRNLNLGDLDHLSERIKREKLKQAQIKQDHVHTEKQILCRTPQKTTPVITQRPIVTQRSPQFQHRQVAPRLQNAGQMTPRPLQQRMVASNPGLVSPIRADQRKVMANSTPQTPRQKAPMTPQRPIPAQTELPVHESPEFLEKGRMTQQSCTPKSDTESNSSESYAYLQRVIADPHTAIVQQQITGNVAKMLVVLLDGEQRLITFDIPLEECTVQDLLDQVSVPVGSENVVSLVNDPTLGINYIVEVQPPLEPGCEQNEPKGRSQENSKNCPRNPSPTSLQYDENSNSSTSQIEEPKYVEGKLAVCPHCGVLSSNFNHCERCKRKLPEHVKSISDSHGNKDTKELVLSCDNFYKKVDHSLNKLEKIEREGTPARGRGRGRGGARARKPIKEPECLIISSDEEHEAEKSAKYDSMNTTFPGTNEGTNLDESGVILEKEPIITNQSATAVEGIQGSERDSDDQIAECPTSTIHTLLSCRTVRIGSYKYIPIENVIVSEYGLRLNVPFLEDHKKLVRVDVKFKQIVRLLAHFGKGMPVLFFYTTTATGVMIRDVLGMQDPKGPYFDPASRDHTHKRITLLPDKICEESRMLLKSLYDGKLEELSPKEANDILVRASPKDCIQQVLSRRSSSQSTPAQRDPNTNGVIQTITVYPPPPAKGGIAINTEDYLCLGEDQFLNDVIIDFYLKYLTSEILSEEDRNRTHVFSSYFYKRLTSPHASAALDSNMPQTAAGKRHARVQKWTKNVNIFEKDFIVIPINEHAHWFLAIICFPGLVGKITAKPPIAKEEALKSAQRTKRVKEVKLQSMTIGNTTITPVTTTTITIDQGDDGSERDEAEGDDDEMEMDSEDDDELEEEEEPASVESKLLSQEKTEKLPCILIFDSLAGASRCRVVATLRDYLFCEHIAKQGSEKVFSKDTIKGASPKVPQQSNFTDCGVYVLQYVESFFKDPIQNYTLPIKTLKNWFEEIIVTRKREELSKLLIELMKKTSKNDKTISLPSVSFPTQDGKLKPKSETEKASTKTEEGKKKTEIEVKTSSVVENAETQDRPSDEVTSKTVPLIPYSSTSSSSSSSTEGNVLPELTNEVIPPVRSSVETMNYLKSKRIQRIVMKSDNSDDKPAAKKLKSDNADSCK